VFRRRHESDFLFERSAQAAFGERQRLGAPKVGMGCGNAIDIALWTVPERPDPRLRHPQPKLFEFSSVIRLIFMGGTGPAAARCLPGRRALPK